MISNTWLQKMRETGLWIQWHQVRPYSAAHDTSTTRIIRTRKPAASRSLDRCGADAVRDPRARRRCDVQDALQPSSPRLAHGFSARSSAPDEARHSHQGTRHFTRSVPLGTRSRRRPGSSQRATRAPHTDTHLHRYQSDTHSLSSRKRAALSGTHCSKCPCIPMGPGSPLRCGQDDSRAHKPGLT